MSVTYTELATINYEIFDDGNRLAGSATIEFPELKYLTSEIKGAGIAGTINFPIRGHMDDLTAKITWRTIFAKPLKLMRQQPIILSARGAMQGYDAAKGIVKVIPVRIDMRAHPLGLTLGKFEPAAQTGSENGVAVDYIKISVDGKTWFEHDKFNMKYTVDGEDLLDEVRDAIGI